MGFNAHSAFLCDRLLNMFCSAAYKLAPPFGHIKVELCPGLESNSWTKSAKPQCLCGIILFVLLYRNHLLVSSGIQKFLKNMVDFCRKQTTSGSASYGVVTGFAVSKNVGKYMNYDDWYKDEKFSDLAEVIRICLANNLLIPHPMTQGGKGERWLVYYLNRWLCAYINIPFDYGGWRKISLINLNKWI